MTGPKRTATGGEHRSVAFLVPVQTERDSTRRQTTEGGIWAVPTWHPSQRAVPPNLGQSAACLDPAGRNHSGRAVLGERSVILKKISLYF